MDGVNLLRHVRELLCEISGNSFLDDQLTYDYLYEAALDYVERTNCLRTTQSITTVADQAAYDLNSNYLNLYLKNDENRFYIKYNNSSSSVATDQFIYWKDDEEIIFSNDTTSVTIPSEFTIRQKSTFPTRISSTTTSVGASVAGEATLTDTASDFTDVEAGDLVHNTTDGSTGIVLSKTSTTVLITALFGGTANDYTNGDAYVIQPQGRFELVLNPPPSNVDTVTVYYVEKPAPVYSNYGQYRFQRHGANAIIKYACWLYKYRDQEPNFGDALFSVYTDMVKKASTQFNHSINRGGYKVNRRKRHGSR